MGQPIHTNPAMERMEALFICFLTFYFTTNDDGCLDRFAHILDGDSAHFGFILNFVVQEYFSGPWKKSYSGRGRGNYTASLLFVAQSYKTYIGV